MLRDLKVWLNRASECRNPLILGQALNYERQRFELLRLATGLSSAEIRQLLREIEDDRVFLDEIRQSLHQWTEYSPRAIDFMLFQKYGAVFFNEVTWYAIVRARQPEVVIETGGTPGKSTAFILRAMERNNTGHLYTIDLPPPEIVGDKLKERGNWHSSRPSGLASGWVVPQALRSRHTQLLGPSREHLPVLLDQLNQIDIFLHDSDHSYENMLWEFETAFPTIKQGGLILSDDVMANESFFDFCQQKQLRYINVFNQAIALID